MSSIRGIHSYGALGLERKGTRTSHGRTEVGLIVSILILLAYGDASALGAQTRVLKNSFGASVGLSAPQGLDVDQASKSVYVADSGNHRIDKFDPFGSLLLAFGADVGGPGVNTCTPACGPGTAGSAPGQFETAEFVAVDNAPKSSSFHDVYVGDTSDNLVSKFDASGKLVASWGSGGQLSGSTTGAGSFGSLNGIAVDGSGRLLVLGTQGEGNPQEFVFTPSGTFSEEFRLARILVPPAHGIAVNAAGSLFKVNGDGSVEESTAKGEEIGTVTPDPEPAPPGAGAIAINPSDGSLFVASMGNSIDHYAFNGSGQVIEPSGPPCTLELHKGCAASDSSSVGFAGSGIAVLASSENTYLSNASGGEVDQFGPLVTVPDVVTGAATEVAPTSATLNGTINPDGIAVTDCHFEYVNAAEYNPEAKDPYSAGKSVACEQTPAQIGSGTSVVPVTAKVTGLQQGVTYHFRLDTANTNGPNTGADRTFTTATLPVIDSASATELTPSAVKLNATINPDNGETSYRFEYSTTTGYGTTVPTPAGDIGSGSSDVAVSQHIMGLSPNVTYHWRVVATNTAGTTTGVDHTFIYATSGTGLPDGRAYEMVTPPHKNGALINDLFILGFPPVISDDGSQVIASSLQCFAGSGACTGRRGDGIGAPFEFARTGEGWTTTPLSPPATVLAANSPRGLSANAGTALFSGPTPPFGEDDFYLRQPDSTLRDVGPNTPPAEGANGPLGGLVQDRSQANSADFSHFAWETVAGRWPFDATQPEGLTTYEYVGTGNSQPLLVGVTGGRGSHDLVSVCGTALGTGVVSFPPVMVSAQGQTVFFTALAKGVGVPCPSGSGANAGVPVPVDAVYARVHGELPDAHSVPISEPSPSECGEGAAPGEKSCREAASKPANAGFAGASSDGSKAFFNSTQQLTSNASEDSEVSDDASAEGGCTLTTGANGCNLYEYDLNASPGHHVTDVSAGDTSGEGPRVQGVLALSPEATHVYFVAKGVLTSVANARGQTAINGANNLYMFEHDSAHPAGKTSFIAELPPADVEEWKTHLGSPANVTPDGRTLVFVSHGNLTADDTSKSGAQQVFRFDAETGALIRISVGNEGFDDNGNRSTATPCAILACSEDARIVPTMVLSQRSDPTMSNDGRFIFFESPVALARGALDDVRIGEGQGVPAYAQNVYEWHEGHVFLISDGRDVSASEDTGATIPWCNLSSVCLLGTDVTGANVFFSTADRLVGQDVDTELDYYDARICTEASPCLNQSASVAAGCEGESCQGVPASQPPPVAAESVTFYGPGNLAPQRPPPVGRVKVLGDVTHSAGFLLTVEVPGPGRIAVTGGGITPVRRSVARAGRYRLAIHLTKRERALLRHRRGHAAVLHMSVSFASADGKVSTVRLIVAVRA